MTVEDYPQTILEFEQMFATEEACPLVFVSIVMAGRFFCPRYGHAKAYATKRGFTAVTIAIILSGLDHRRHHLPGYQETLEVVVQGYLAFGQSEEWSQCFGPSKSSGIATV